MLVRMRQLHDRSGDLRVAIEKSGYYPDVVSASVRRLRRRSAGEAASLCCARLRRV